MTAQDTTALEVNGIYVELASGSPVVDGVSLHVSAGEILGLVGESGSGKTTTALSIFGYSDRGLVIRDNTLTIGGEEIHGEAGFRRARGRLVSYTPQNPGTALNPSMRVADAIADLVTTHRPRADSDLAAQELLSRVGLPADRSFGRRYPHQLSGGQQQRVCIAASLTANPTLVVLDEPTTGLDVVTQDRILKELLKLRDEEKVAMLYITHDLAVVAQIADRIAVMYAGRVVEQGPAEEILRRPRHPYTRGLMAATPDHVRPRVLETMPGVSVGVEDRGAGCAFAPRCSQALAACASEVPEPFPAGHNHSVRCFEWRSTPPVSWQTPDAVARSEDGSVPATVILEVNGLCAEYHTRGETVVAASDISFTVERAACVALVGESGSGKTTIGRVIAGLHPTARGELLLHGERLPFLARRRTVEQRRRLQVIFQNPYQALNPRHTVADSIARPARVLRGLDRAAAGKEVIRLLEAVRLPVRLGRRYPRELSGGERQRVAIARALAASPELLICDEITSALDVSVQAVVLDLLRELRDDFGLALIFITHDLGVVATVAETTLVLNDGAIVERGRTRGLLSAPQHPYTQRLLEAAPSLSGAIEAWDAVLRPVVVPALDEES